MVFFEFKVSTVKLSHAFANEIVLYSLARSLTSSIFLVDRKSNIVNFLVSPQEHAFENSQKYKEGKFIIEMIHMIKDNGWE